MDLLKCLECLTWSNLEQPSSSEENTEFNIGSIITEHIFILSTSVFS